MRPDCRATAPITKVAETRFERGWYEARDRIDPAFLIFIGDFQREIPGMLDPADHKLLRGEKSDEFVFLICLGHYFREIRRVTVFEFPHGRDADLSQ